jgi:hypothetical protein
MEDWEEAKKEEEGEEENDEWGRLDGRPNVQLVTRALDTLRAHFRRRTAVRVTQQNAQRSQVLTLLNLFNFSDRKSTYHADRRHVSEQKGTFPVHLSRHDPPLHTPIPKNTRPPSTCRHQNNRIRTSTSTTTPVFVTTVVVG